jgi:peroxiredoxin
MIGLLFSCNKENMYKITVNLSNLNPQEVYVVYESADFKTVDTILYKGSGSFVLTQKPDSLQLVTLYYDDFSRWIPIYLEQPGRIMVYGDAVFPQLAQVKGGRINELLSGFRKETATLLKDYYTIYYGTDSIPESLNKPNRIARLANINHEIRIHAETFIQKNPSEKASAILIRDYFVDADHPLRTESLLADLKPELDDFYVVKDLKAFVAKARSTLVGAKAPDFNVRNIYGESFQINTFMNKYFLLAFTYMWNDQYHTGELHLDDIISIFPKDSLNVMLVTLDENPKELRDLSRRDPIRWNIVSDSIGQAIELLDLYNVNVLPRCFLIDKEGHIILKTDNGVEVKQALEQLIKKTDK